MLGALISLFFLLVFSEFSSANFKRLAPILEAWDASKRLPNQEEPKLALPWNGGWAKGAALLWALGSSIPLLAFSLACHLFLKDKAIASNLMLGSMIGSNVIALSLALGMILVAGPITFFRLRTMTSPVFLLLATVAFSYACLNYRISRWEGAFLLLLSVGYGFYFRSYSSEWKYFERNHPNESILESSDGLLPIFAFFCLGIGFFVLALGSAYPFVLWIYEYVSGGIVSDTKAAVHLVAFLLSTPWLIRSLLSLRESTTGRALTLTSLTHSCMLNVLFLPGIMALIWGSTLAPRLLSLDIPVLLVYTGIFVSVLLIEKESGRILTALLSVSYLLYTGLGVLL